MDPSDTVEYNSLNWVKKELDLVLEDAQKAFNTYIDDTSEKDELQECIDQIHLIHGTLLMVELYGAAMLAEEIEELVKCILNEEVSGNEEIYQLIMGAMLRLPDYLDGLISGNKDVPIVLLPVLNDLRAARNESLLSESLLFFPDVDSDDVTVEDIVVDAAHSNELQSLAKRLRPHFQLGLLTWFKNEKPLSGLKRIQAVINELEKNSVEKKVRRLWTVSSALLESLIHKGINSSITIKLLIGKIDRLNKELIDKGETALEKTLPADVIKNLLYYIARSDSLGERVSNIKDAYKLNELLPGNVAENEAALNMGGPNIDLLQTVAQAIREDFTEVKDALEVFVHGDERDRSKLESLPGLLAKIADTMGMLGLGAPRQMILDQKVQVEKFFSGELDATDHEVMDVASVLLNAEAKLNNFIARRSVKTDETSEVDSEYDSEYQEVLSSVAREALSDFNQAKQLILLFADSPEDDTNLEQVVTLFGAAGGAMFMAPLDILAPLIRGISGYIETVLIKAKQLVPEQLDVVADAVTSIEYYLEAVIEGRKDLKADLNFGRSAVEKLRDFASQVDVSGIDIKEEVIEEPVAESSDVSEDLTIAEAAIPEVDDIDLSLDDSSFQIEESVEDIDFGLEVEEATLEADVAPAPVVKQAAVVTEREELAIIGEDTDEEIFEIFIEEALEVLAAINECLPVWRADNNNEEARSTVRRSFHTLKGSGRLIGAMMIGEFSWSIESMLNKVIENNIQLNEEVFSVLDESAAVLPQLIEQMQGNKQPVANIYDLMDHADAISKGEKYSPPAETEVAEVVASEDLALDDAVIDEVDLGIVDLETEQLPAEDDALVIDDEIIELTEDIGSEIELIEDSDAAIDFDEGSFDISDEIEFDSSEIELLDDEAEEPELSIELDSVVEDEEDEFSFEVSEDEISLEDTFEVEPEELTIDSDENISLPEVPVKVEIDAELFKIFHTESEGHLDTIRHILILNQTDGAPVVANDELIRALHTLYGSARTAEVPAIASVCGSAEQYIKIKQEHQSLEVEAAGVTALNELVATVTEVLGKLEQGKSLLVNQSLIDTFDDLYKKEAEKSPEASIEADLHDNELISYGDIDDELVDIFLEEAEELVEGAEVSLLSWKENLDDVESVNELKRILHTLKGGARMAELAPIGDLTHALETTIIESAEVDPTPVMPAMQEALDTIVNMLTKVSNREPLQSAAPTIALLNQKGSPAKQEKVVIADEVPDSELDLSILDEQGAENLFDKAIDDNYELSDDLEIESDTEFSSPDIAEDFSDEVEIDILSPEEESVIDVEPEELELIEDDHSDDEELTIISDEVSPDSKELSNSRDSNVFTLDHSLLANKKEGPKEKVVQE
ncbi:MAG: Hpt domain-containing protein, partial [Gammaproteobacteria bacterium]|nr:Hpt domain-containing protein [Gammaproteobacteria bacterium]